MSRADPEILVSGYDFERPYIDPASMQRFEARDDTTADAYGRIVLAVELSNMDYQLRFQRLNGTRTMKAPPVAKHVLPGHLVVRHPGQPRQYETWMPEHVFADLYKPATR